MKTQCTSPSLPFQASIRRDIVARFDGGAISSDGDGLLLKQVECRTGIVRQFATCFTDHRDPDLIEHTVEELIAQRLYGLALGYEDLNDHEELRHDPVLATLVGKADPSGRDRLRQRDQGKALAGNARLQRKVTGALEQAKQQFLQTHQARRVFIEFPYRTRKSWSRSRRVVAKAEYLPKGENPRFVVTSISSEERAADVLYEQHYCARGDMENRIKEQQLCLFADRTSCGTMRANQLRLWFSSPAYTLLVAFRRLGLTGTELARAQCDTIHLKLLKIGALIRVTVRKVWISLSESYPYRDLFVQVYHNLVGTERIPMRC